jgi:hypothetical protein
MSSEKLNHGARPLQEQNENSLPAYRGIALADDIGSAPTDRNPPDSDGARQIHIELPVGVV